MNNKELRERNNLNKENEIILDSGNIDEINYLINNDINVIEDSEDDDYVYEIDDSEYEEMNDLEIIENEYENNSLILNLKKDLEKFNILKNLFFNITKEANKFKYKLFTLHNENTHFLIHIHIYI